MQVDLKVDQLTTPCDFCRRFGVWSDTKLLFLASFFDVSGLGVYFVGITWPFGGELERNTLHSESTAHRTPHTTKSDITKERTRGTEMDTGRLLNGTPHMILNLRVQLHAWESIHCTHTHDPYPCIDRQRKIQMFPEIGGWHFGLTATTFIHFSSNKKHCLEGVRQLLAGGHIIAYGRHGAAWGKVAASVPQKSPRTVRPGRGEGKSRLVGKLVPHEIVSICPIKPVFLRRLLHFCCHNSMGEGTNRMYVLSWKHELAMIHSTVCTKEQHRQRVHLR